VITALLHDEAEKKLFASHEEASSLRDLVDNLSRALSKITYEGEAPPAVLAGLVDVGSGAVAEMARLTPGGGRSNPLAFYIQRVNERADRMMSSGPEMSPTLRMAITGHAMIQRLDAIETRRQNAGALEEIAAMAVCSLRMHRAHLAPLVTTTPVARCGERDIYSLKRPPKGASATSSMARQGVVWHGHGNPPPLPEI
jgi:hypothetical protein